MLGAMFASWYLANIVFNMCVEKGKGGKERLSAAVCADQLTPCTRLLPACLPARSYNKQVLKAFPFPLTCTTAQVRRSRSPRA